MVSFMVNFDLTLYSILLLPLGGPHVIMWVLLSSIQKVESALECCSGADFPDLG